MEQITEDEILFIETWHTPKALVEILFHNWDNLNSFNPSKFGKLRLYQESLLSDEAIVDFELTAELEELNEQEIFDGRKRVGDLYCFGARKFGKSRIAMIMDLVVQMLTHPGDIVALGSVDLIHLKQILDPITNCFENHPICKLWTRKISGSPDYRIEMKTDWVLNSVNFNIGSKSPGQNFFGKHVFRLYIEEASLETEQVYEKRKDALSELGAVIRCSGMTNFTPQSPAGKAFYSSENQPWVVNLPQYINPTWNENKQKKAEEEYGGRHSIGYRIYVDGAIIEDGISVFDMQRVRQNCIVEKKVLTTIEINKDRFKHFQAFISVDRPGNADRIFLNADIGLNVTEINIISEVKGKYEYLYNITLNCLIDDEQATIIKYLAQVLRANVIAGDCGDGMGRAIWDELEKTIPKENLCRYAGTNKVVVGWETNSNGEVLLDDNGTPIEKEEFMSEWAVKRLKDLFYQGLMILPEDFKFVTQFTQVICLTSGTRIIYKCIAKQGDHLFDSFRVFAIAEWLKASANLTPPLSNTWGTGASN